MSTVYAQRMRYASLYHLTPPQLFRLNGLSTGHMTTSVAVFTVPTNAVCLRRIHCTIGLFSHLDMVN
jgi:hypothetical protein